MGSVGGFGGAHIGGGVGHIGGLGGTHIGAGINRFDGPRASFADHGHFGGLHHHAMHRFGRFYPGYYGYDTDCYDWDLLHPDTAFPAYCS
jgi:hypothetical protein